MDYNKYKNIKFQKRTHCVICETMFEPAIIDLPDFPITEVYCNEKPKEKIGFCDQAFHFCPNCGHGQLSNVIDIELQYGDNSSYNFRTSKSETGTISADFFIEFMNKNLSDTHYENIVEIGCNDLYLLKSLKSRAKKLIGIDPVLKGIKEDTENNITVISDFFENVKIDKDVDIIICKDTLEHIPNPLQFVEKVILNSSNETLYFFQFPILETLLNACRFDQIFHQHLNYFTLKSIIYMLNKLGCELIDYTIEHKHWGAILILFKKGTNNSKFSGKIKEIKLSDILNKYSIFKNNMKTTNKRLNLAKNENVYGYGAALMLSVLSYHLNNDFSCLKCIIDDDVSKDGLFYINLPVQIQHSVKIKDINESIVLLTAISSLYNVRKILAKLFDLTPKQILIPLNTI